MTQVLTRDTIEPGEALDRIRTDALCVRLHSDSTGVAFIRDDPENDSDTGDYLVSVYVPVVEERRTHAVDGGQATEAIKNAEAARLVPVEDSPWGGNSENRADDRFNEWTGFDDEEDP